MGFWGGGGDAGNELGVQVKAFNLVSTKQPKTQQDVPDVGIVSKTRIDTAVTFRRMVKWDALRQGGVQVNQSQRKLASLTRHCTCGTSDYAEKIPRE